MRMLDCDSNAIESCAPLSERLRFFDTYAFSIVASQNQVDYEHFRGEGEPVTSRLMQKHKV